MEFVLLKLSWWSCGVCGVWWGYFFVVCTADFVGTTYEILVACRFFYKTNCTQKLALL